MGCSFLALLNPCRTHQPLARLCLAEWRVCDPGRLAHMRFNRAWCRLQLNMRFNRAWCRLQLNVQRNKAHGKRVVCRHYEPCFLRPPAGVDSSCRKNRYAMLNDDARAQEAINLTLLHWGVHGWTAYVIVGLLLAAVVYRKCVCGLALRASLHAFVCFWHVRGKLAGTNLPESKFATIL